MRKPWRKAEYCFWSFRCLRQLAVAAPSRISPCNHPFQSCWDAQNTSPNSFDGLENELKNAWKCWSRSVESCFRRLRCLRRLAVAAHSGISSCNHLFQSWWGAKNKSQNNFRGLENELKNEWKNRPTAWNLASHALSACDGWLWLRAAEFRAATTRFRVPEVPETRPKTVSTGLKTSSKVYEKAVKQRGILLLPF